MKDAMRRQILRRSGIWSSSLKKQVEDMNRMKRLIMTPLEVHWEEIKRDWESRKR